AAWLRSDRLRAAFANTRTRADRAGTRAAWKHLGRSWARFSSSYTPRRRARGKRKRGKRKCRTQVDRASSSGEPRYHTRRPEPLGARPRSRCGSLPLRDQSVFFAAAEVKATRTRRRTPCFTRTVGPSFFPCSC